MRGTTAARFAAAALAAIAAMVAILVIIGWHTGIRWMAQIAPDVTPMMHNAAIGTLFMAVAIIAKAARCRSCARLLSVPAFLIAGLTLAQFAFSINLGIDSLFVDPGVLHDGSTPGRMAPNTAIALLFLPAAVWLMTGNGKRRIANVTAAVFGALVSAIAVTALAGYALNITSAYQWGVWTQMAPNTAAAMLLCGIAILVLEWARERETGVSPSWPALISGVVGTAITLLLARAVQIDHGNSPTRLDALILLVGLVFSVLLAAAVAFARAARERAAQAESARRQLAAELELRRRGEARQRFLFELGEAITTTLDPESTLQAIAANAVPEIADWCIVDLLGEDQQFHRVAAAHVDPAKQWITEELHRRYPPRLNSPQPTAVAIKTGELVRVRPVSEAELRAITIDDDHYQLARQLNPRDAMAVPITARGRVVGAISFAFAESGRTYDELDVRLAKEVADRAAGAIERAEMYSATELERNKLKAILDVLPVGVFIADANGKLEAMNEASSRIWGGQAPEVGAVDEYGIYKGWRPSGEQLRPEDWGLARALRGESSINEEVTIEAFDGAVKNILNSGVPVQDREGHVVGAIAAVVDVTEQKRAEEEVRRLNRDLERIVEERTRALTAANRELESFAYSVSHDLRTPLRAIEGFSQALTEDAADALSGDARDYLGRIQAATQRMARLIDDMLALSRVTRAELTKQRVDLAALAREIVNDAAGTSAAPVDFRTPESVCAEADPRLIRAVLENLLGNAVKFSSRSPSPRIELGTICENDGHTIYYVRDNGVGFDMQYADKLFAPFQRLHSPREYEGTGVGLATVQRIIHRHGGRVWAEAESGKGATFYFTTES